MVSTPASSLKTPAAHLPRPRPPVHWAQPEHRTPTSHSILLEPAPYVGTDSPDLGASRPGYSVGHSWYAHCDTHTGNRSWGGKSRRCGTWSFPPHRSRPQELLRTNIPLCFTWLPWDHLHNLHPKPVLDPNPKPRPKSTPNTKPQN